MVTFEGRGGGPRESAQAQSFPNKYTPSPRRGWALAKHGGCNHGQTHLGPSPRSPEPLGKTATGCPHRCVRSPQLRRVL